MTNNYKKLLLSSLLSSLLLANANASNLEIKNDTSSEVNIVIEGEGGTIGTNKEAIKSSLKSGGTETVQVDRTTFGVETFSITGKVTMPSTNNKCELLLIDKDYKILFIEGKAGMIICKAIEK